MSSIVKIGELSVDISVSTSKLRANLAQASSLIRDFSLLSQGLTGGITSAFQQVTGVAVRGLQTGLTALVGTFTLAAKTGADFEDEMIRAFTIMKEGGNASASSLSEMTSKALQLGRDTLFSATDAAQGMQVLARAGFNTKEVINSIGPVMNLAIADNLELAESSEYVINALRGFNLESTEARRVTDIMTLGASKASMSVSDLGEAFRYVAPVAAGMGISIEETVAAIGLLSDAGLKGSLAGTTLRRAFSELISPTKKAQQILDELGVTTVTSSGKLRPFASILQDLKSAGMTAAQAMEVFGQRGGPGMIALLERGAGPLRDLTNDLENSKGAAEDMAQAFRTTVKGRIKDVIASVVDFGLAFSEKFKKPLADAIFAIRNFVVDIVNIGNRMGIFKAIVNGFQGALEPITKLIKVQAEEFKKWLTTLTPDKIAKFFGEIKKAFTEFSESIQKGNLRAAIKDTFAVLLGFGKVFLGIFKSLAETFVNMDSGLRKFVLVVAIVNQLSGGFLNILGFLISINALWAAMGVKASLSGVALGAVWTTITQILVLTLLVGAAIAGWKLGKFLSELDFVKSYMAAIVLLFRAAVPTIQLMGMALAGACAPALWLNKTFRNTFKELFETVKEYQRALLELDWLGLKSAKNDLEKIGDGIKSVGTKAGELAKFIESVFTDKKMKLDIEAPKIPKMEYNGEEFGLGEGNIVELPVKTSLEMRKAEIIANHGAGPEKRDETYIKAQEEYETHKAEWKEKYKKEQAGASAKSQALIEKRRKAKGPLDEELWKGAITGEERGFAIEDKESQLATLTSELQMMMKDEGVGKLTQGILDETALVLKLSDELRVLKNVGNTISGQVIQKTTRATYASPAINSGCPGEVGGW